MRTLYTSFILVAALLTQGCATNEERMPVHEAAEAQRLVFGTPNAVRTQFASQIGNCWFGAMGPLRDAYTFTMPTVEAADGPSIISIFGLEPERTEVFQVQFYPHNDNTVVATRNLALPDGVAQDLETSVELWLLEPSQCRLGGDTMAEQSAWDPRLQQADAGENELRLPPLEDGQTRAEDGEIDMHQAELRARGAIE